MKAEASKRFEPVVLNITIESEEELESLWHRLTISSKEVLNSNNIYNRNKDNTCLEDVSLWKVLNKITYERRLRG